MTTDQHVAKGVTQKIIDYLGTQKWLIYGGISGALSRTLTAPLERLKILNQVQHMDTGGPRYVGVLPALKKIWKEEGFRAYWKGNGTNVIRIVPSDATRFYSYDMFKKLLIKEGEPMTGYIRVLAGGLAGMASTLATYPLDMVRTRLSVQTIPTADSKLLSTRYRGVFHCLFRICKEEGFLALYKGMGISMMGVAPYVAINFSTYETIKQFVGQQEQILSGLVIGGVAGTVAVTLTYPTDVLRRRMMMDGLGDNPRAYSGILDACIKIAKHEGLPGFFRGLLPCYLKVVPSTAISWATIEICRKIGGS